MTDHEDARMLARLRTHWRAVDPVPAGLIDRMVAAVASDGLNSEYALLTLVEGQLGEVRAVIDEGEPVDLYKYRNPYAPAPNRFDKGYKPPPSPEQVSQGGGYVMYGLYSLIGVAAKGLQSLPGVKGPIQSAVARPPPQLSDDQLRRAAACTDGSGCAAASDMAGN